MVHGGGGDAERVRAQGLLQSQGTQLGPGVGTRPAEVWGLVTKPNSSRSAITLRMVAADKSSPEKRDKVREPIGCPSSIYRSIKVLRSARDRSSMLLVILCLWFNRYMLSPSAKSAQNGFRRIALVGKYQAEGIGERLHELAILLVELGCEVFVEADTAKHVELKQYPTQTLNTFATTIDLTVVLGGDGTMLGIGRKLAGSQVPLVGINMGRLGYMTDIPIQDIASVLPQIIRGEY